MAEGDWSAELPRSIKQRLDGIGNYVISVLDESDLRRQLTSTEIQRIHLLAFAKALDEFLLDGAAAAEHAVDEFESLGITGFRIGTELFEGRNEAVTRG